MDCTNCHLIANVCNNPLTKSFLCKFKICFFLHLLQPLSLCLLLFFCWLSIFLLLKVPFEACREKSCLCGLRPSLTQIRLTHTVQPQNLPICLKFTMKKEGLYYLCSENKGADQLICIFVFHVYAKISLFHVPAHS